MNHSAQRWLGLVVFTLLTVHCFADDPCQEELLLSGGAIAPATSLASEKATGGTVTGKVVKSGTTIAVRGALVKIRTKSATTAANGTFSITGLLTGSTTIKVTKTGYKPYSKGIWVVSGTLPLGTLKIVAIPVGGKVAGKIVTAGTGIGLSGVRISCGNVVFTTGTDGLYTLSGVPAGTQTLLATKASYESYEETVTIVAGGTLTRNIALTAAISTAKLFGRVTNALGKPMANSTVSIDGTMTDTTDAGGNYEFPSVPQGNRTLKVVGPPVVYKWYTASIFLTTSSREYNVQLVSLLPLEFPDGHPPGAAMGSPVEFGWETANPGGGTLSIPCSTGEGMTEPEWEEVIKSVQVTIEVKVLNMDAYDDQGQFVVLGEDTVTKSMTLPLPNAITVNAPAAPGPSRHICYRITECRIINIDGRSMSIIGTGNGQGVDWE